MKLSILLRTTGPTPRLDLDFVLEAERLGFDSAWTSEAWGGDAVTTVSARVVAEAVL
jgi:alkanesulfonate monooxygenase SsuD/methylene tetrahydromethanopterin reductase-like flavin-dependent oxidoreductase (luciferase family)